MITAIAAIGRNRELGKGNDLLWKISEDLKRARTITMGHPLIMGRKTFESILAIRGSALPGRTSVVLTRDHAWRHHEAVVAHTLEEALKLAAGSPGGENIFIFGGAEIYRLMLPYTERLLLTEVDAEADADAFFPSFSDEFIKVTAEPHEADGLRYSFSTYARKQ